MDEMGNPTEEFTGLEAQVLKMAGQKMGFELEFFLSTNSRYNKKTNTWSNGTIQQVTHVGQ